MRFATRTTTPATRTVTGDSVTTGFTSSGNATVPTAFTVDSAPA